MSKASKNGVRRNWPRTLGLAMSIATATVLAGAGDIVQAASVNESSYSTVKVDPALLAAVSRGEAPAVLVKFRGEADLSSAFGMTDGDARATWVYETLTSFAAQKQAQARQTLAGQFQLSEAAHDYTVLWIDNSIAIAGMSAPMLDALRAAPNVKEIRLQREIPLPVEPDAESPPWQTFAIETNLTHIQVPDVWALGFKGAGIVVANIDTGVRHTHQSLVGKYRGNLGGGSFNHNYNWYDPYNHSATPRTSHPHGSHTMGTMVGDDGSANQTGVAPDAKWMACIGFGAGGGSGATDAGLLECGQWALAPYPTSGSGTPDPTRHADVVNNSWGDCGQSYDNWYEGVINGWIAAGIVPIFSNGNASNCGYPNNPPLNTVGNPARSGKVLGIGSTSKDTGQYAPHSNKGPTDNPNPGLPTYPDPAGFANLKPNVSAPGVNIRAANNTSDSAYYLSNGTSMSAPHAAGLVALMWNAAPCLKGNYAITGTLMMNTATAIPVNTGSPSDGPGNVPNQATGWGEINALGAVNAAIAYCAGGGDLPPTLQKSFAPTDIVQGTNSTLTLTLGNVNATPATLDANLVDNLPAGVVVAGTPSASTTCTGGSVGASAGGSTVTLNAGAQIPATGTCTVTVSVTAPAAGSFVNTIPAGGLSTDKGDSQSAASATLTVNDGTTFQCSGPINHALAATTAGTSINWATGAIEDDDNAGFDLNIWNNGGLAMYWASAPAGNAAVAPATNSSDYTVLQAGATVGPASTWSRTAGAMTSFRAGVDGYLGFRYECAEGTCYGYAHFTTTAATGYPATLVDYCHDTSGAAVTIGGGGTNHTVTPSVGTPSGTISPSTPQSVADGATTQFTLTPAAGFQIDNVGGTCGGSLAGNVYTTNAITADCTVIANFETSGGGTDPVIQVAPGALAFEVAAGAGDSEALTIANIGGGTLTWNITTAEPATVDRNASKADTPRARPLTSLRQGGPMGPVAGLASHGGHIAATPGGSTELLGATDMSQTADTVIAAANSIACPTPENRLLRRFYFNEHPGAGNTIESVDVGVQEGVSNQTLTVNLYSIPHGTPVDTIPTSALTLIGTGTRAISAADDNTLVNVPVAGTIADTAANDLVVEVVATTDAFYIGATTAAETHTGFIMAPNCGATEPAPIHSLGPDFANTNIIIVANTVDGGGDVCDSPATIPWLTLTPTNGSTPAGQSSNVDVGVDATGLAAGDYHAMLCVNSNDPATPLVQVPLDLTVTGGSTGACSAGDTIFCDGFDPAAGPFVQPVQDPSFEATTADAGSNPFWEGTDSNDPGGTPFYSDGFGIDVHTGSWEAWFGGWHSGVDATQEFWQDVTIASGGPRFINYWRNVVLAPVGTAVLTVKVDGNVVATTDVVANGVDPAWTNVSVDISSYADNGTHEIRFTYETSGADDGNVFIDDV
ncbi:MAG TPA: S8 family serine peptidase, partial [Dokdonella sp.]